MAAHEDHRVNTVEEAASALEVAAAQVQTQQAMMEATLAAVERLVGDRVDPAEIAELRREVAKLRREARGIVKGVAEISQGKIPSSAKPRRTKGTRKGPQGGSRG